MAFCSRDAVCRSFSDVGGGSSAWSSASVNRTVSTTTSLNDLQLLHLLVPHPFGSPFGPPESVVLVLQVPPELCQPLFLRDGALAALDLQQLFVLVD